MSTARFEALKVLVSVLNNEASLTILNQRAAPSFAKMLCYGVCRYYYRLAAIADSLLKKRPKETEIWVSILMGIYEIEYLSTPPYAVIKETVELAKTYQKIWAKGLINAVLRNYLRQQENIKTKLKKNDDYLYSHPHWLLQKLQLAWPDAWTAIVAANNTHPPLCLRVNTQKISRNKYLEKLLACHISAEPLNHSPQGILLQEPREVTELPGFTEGEVSVQDEAAQLAASLLDLKPNLRVLDACAAPGGKTCHLLEQESHLKSCVAVDIEAKRCLRIQENLSRLGLHAEVIVGDALNPAAWWDKHLFDRILLDAPCSATGVIRRHPDIKLLRTPEEIQKIIKIQQDLLKVLWNLLAPGGLLLYATCSILPEENDQQIKRLIENQETAEVKPITANWGIATPYGKQILPHHTMDGFYYSLLIKRGG